MFSIYFLVSHYNFSEAIVQHVRFIKVFSMCDALTGGVKNDNYNFQIVVFSGAFRFTVGFSVGTQSKWNHQGVDLKSFY